MIGPSGSIPEGVEVFEQEEGRILGSTDGSL